MTIHGSSRILGVFGDPIAHSLSPQMHQRFAESCGEDTVYVPFRVSVADLGTAVAAIRALHLSGVNVTIPHKEAVGPLLDELTAPGVAIGAVNTIVNHDGWLIGDNTDAEGFLADIEDHFPHGSWRDRLALVLGAGGAARAVVYALAQAGVPEVVVANRTPEKAQALVQELAPDRARAVSLPGPDLDSALRNAGLVVNTTSLGLEGETIPGLCLNELPRDAGVYDLIYNPPRTPLLQAAEARGLPFANGLGMLVQQGAFSYARWTGKIPQTQPVIRWLNQKFGA